MSIRAMETHEKVSLDIVWHSILKLKALEENILKTFGVALPFPF